MRKAPSRGLFYCATRRCVPASQRTEWRQSSQHNVGGTMGTIITFKRPDGKDASGYLANAARSDAPGVVVIQEWWGLQDQIKGMCERFARAGFDALAPDLYKGTVVPYHDTDAAGREMNSLDFMDGTTHDGAGRAQYP